MKVIKDRKKSTWRKRITCSGCRSTLEVQRSDLGPVKGDRDGSYYDIKCPVCKHANFVATCVFPKE